MRDLTKIGCLLVAIVGFSACSTNFGNDFVNGTNDPGQSGSSITADTSRNYIDKSKYPQASVFPGMVNDTVTRVQNKLVEIDARLFPVSSAEYRISVAPVAIYSTGLYAPTGELIIIDVPAGINGLYAQIGAHQDNLSAIDSPPRDVLIYTRKQLFPGRNYIRSPYGGMLWIRSSNAVAEIAQLKVTGAVETADFILGKTTDIVAWKNRLLASGVPWVELRSKRVVFTVPTNRLKDFVRRGILTDPVLVMKTWDTIYEEDYYKWMGLSENAPELRHRYPTVPERGVADIMPSVGYAHNGNPWVYKDDNYWMDEIVNINTMNRGASWGSYHEVGHNYQQGQVWSFNGLGETTNNLFVFKGAHRHDPNQIAYHPQLQPQFTAAVAAASNYKKAGATHNPGHYSAGNPFYKITPFVQIFKKLRDPDNPSNTEFGWGFMSYLYTKARNADFLSATDLDRRDFVYEALCEYGKRDFIDFFNAWGIGISDYSKEAMATKFPIKMETRLWEYQPLNNTGGTAPNN